MATIRTFYSQTGRAPKTTEVPGIYSALRQGKWREQGLVTWSDLLACALDPEVMYHNKYGGVLGFQRALTDIQSFYTLHGRAPKTYELSRLYYAVRTKRWQAQGFTTWSQLIEYALPDTRTPSEDGSKEVNQWITPLHLNSSALA